MRALSGALLVFALLGQASAQEMSAEDILSNLGWNTGPGSFEVGPIAEIQLGQGFNHLGAGDTRSLMELMQNPTDGTDEFYVGPEDMRWFAVFSYEDSGYIKDDEQIDADAVLDSIRQGTEYTNELRRERGWPEMQILGWQYEPFYENESNRLAWAILGQSEGAKVVNYNTRLLGRTGVMSVTLVSDLEMLDQAVTEFNAVLEGFDYKAGNRYAEYREGDKLAKYGLAALVAGGAAAAVAKSGGKGLLKAILLGVVAVFAGLIGAVKRLFGRKEAKN